MCVKVARVGGGAYLVSTAAGNTSGVHAGSLSAANKAGSPSSFSLLWCKRGHFHLSGQAWLFRATDASLSSVPHRPSIITSTTLAPVVFTFCPSPSVLQFPSTHRFCLCSISSLLSFILPSCLHLLNISPTDRLLCNGQVTCWLIENP